jgi:hypothetical protein
MPATARRSKSEAYEKGVREGKAMAARSRNMEPEEGEEEEGEEEEMDMAMEPGHSRKRSAKGAKHTKPAADGYGMKKPMDAECGCGGKKGGKCDGNCGSMRKRGDSLTPLEYLAACDLGIQDRSTSYIRARLDTAETRNDLKCGKGSISEGEKCTKGPAQRVDPNNKKPTRTTGGSRVRGLKTAAKIAGAAALIGGAAYMQQTARRNTQLRRAVDPKARAKAGAPAPSQKTREIAVMKAREAAWKQKKNKKDSIWADGFYFDSSIYSS